MLKTFFKKNNEVLVFSARVFVSALALGCAVIYTIEKFI